MVVLAITMTAREGPLRPSDRHEDAGLTMLNTIDRAGRVLDLFTDDLPEWGATAVARRLQIAKSQAHEMLVSLAAIGLLQLVGPGRYRLGWRIVALNSSLLSTHEVATTAVPVVRALLRRYDETVQLTVWGSGTPICVGVWEGSRTDASPWASGAVLPAHCTAAGKLLLAARPAEGIAEIVAAEGLVRMTDRTITSLEELQEELSHVRRHGVAHDNEEHTPGICGVAAAIRNADGEVVAALSMSVPAQRWWHASDVHTRALDRAAAAASRLIRQSSDPG
jgi:DNA-binding IclR family transcriptional regulator